MSSRIHPQARTTPKVREEIQDSGLFPEKPPGFSTSREPLHRSGWDATIYEIARTALTRCKILTDNGSQSTDRFTTKDKKPSGKHAFDVACAVLPAEHRLTPPCHPQTNGMVERFNGRINELLQQSHFDSRADLQARSGQSYSLNAFMIKRDLTARRYDMKNGILRSTSAHLFAPACRSGRAWRRRQVEL
jgi:transposase InsO family protein